MNLTKPVLGAEFERNLWIHLPMTSIVVMPVVLALAYAAAILMMRGQSHIEMLDVLSDLSLGMAGLIVIVWGAYNAAIAINEEIGGNTFDFQRTSSISPVAYAFGKLWGATTHVWLYAIPLLVLYVIFDTGSRSGLEGGWAESVTSIISALKVVLYGVIAQAIAFCLSTAGCVQTSAASKKRSGVIGPFAVGVGAAVMIKNMFGTVATAEKAGTLDVIFYGTTVAVTPFMFFSLSLLLTVVYAGIVHFYRTIFRERVYPFAWLYMNAAVLLYAGGLVGAGKVLVISFAFLYGAVMMESSRETKYATFFHAAKTREKLRMLEHMPYWIISLIATITVYGLWVVNEWGTPAMTDIRAHCIILACLLFILRDGLVLHIINWGRVEIQRFWVVLFYMIGYVIIPLIIVGIGKWVSEGQTVETRKSVDDIISNQILPFFLPIANTWLELLAPALVCVALVFVLRRRVINVAKAGRQPA